MEPRHGLPIITSHNGASHALDCCLFQAAHSNPNSEIILIGDDPSASSSFARFEDISRYADVVGELRKHYEHHSVNPPQFELFCMERWLFLHAVMEKMNIERCLHIDSDVLLFTDVTFEAARFSQFDFTLSRRFSGHTMFINSRSALGDFCDWMVSLYRTRSAELEKMISEHRASAGGFNICDMVFLAAFAERPGYSIGETGGVADGAMIDHNINWDAGLRMGESGRKLVIWERGIPYGVEAGTSAPVRMISLHFQGPAKPFIGDYMPSLIPIVDRTQAVSPQLVMPEFQKIEKRTAAAKPPPVRTAVVIMDAASGITPEWVERMASQGSGPGSLDIIVAGVDGSPLLPDPGDFAAIRSLPKNPTFGSLMDLSAADTFVFASARMLVSPGFVAAHRGMLDIDRNILSLGMVWPGTRGQTSYLGLALRSRPRCGPFSLFDTGGTQPFDVFNLWNLSLRREALAVVREVPCGDPLVAGYLLWKDGRRIRAFAHAPAEMIRVPTWKEVDEMISAQIRYYAQLIHGNPELLLLLLGWRRCNQEALATMLNSARERYSAAEAVSTLSEFALPAALESFAAEGQEFNAKAKTALDVLMWYESYRILEAVHEIVPKQLG